MDVRAWNRDAWNRNVDQKNRWTVPVDSGVIERARTGDWEIYLTANKPIPRDWFPDLEECQVLCLASGGGQQAPVLAAAGATVTVFDNSPKQLAQDRFVAERDGLSLTCVEGDMADLTQFADESFDLIVHPCSNAFVKDITPVWRESYRVLRKECCLLAGFVNPVAFLFDTQNFCHGNDPDRTAGKLAITATQQLPWHDDEHLDDPDVTARMNEGEPLEFAHLLSDQIGGQLRAGYSLIGLYEDGFDPVGEYALSRLTPWMIATRAIKT